MKKENINYFQINFNQIITTPEYVVMSGHERGLFWTMQAHLFSNSGSIPLNNTLYKFFNFENEEEFLKIWEKIRHLFRIKNNKITSDIVNGEFHRIREKMQLRKNNGLINAQKRWQCHGNAIPEQNNAIGMPSIAITEECQHNTRKGKESYVMESNVTERNEKEREVKERNVTERQNQAQPDTPETASDGTDFNTQDSSVSASFNSLSSVSDSVSLRQSASPDSIGTIAQKTVIPKLKVEPDKPAEHTHFSKRKPESPEEIDRKAIAFLSELNKTLPPKNLSDRTCHQHITKWLVHDCVEGKFSTELFKKALEIARTSRSGANPQALFISILKKELRYNPKIEYEPAMTG
jgi:hypothetical protein